MTWWQVILVFGCIPAAAYGVIWLVTSILCEARVPDGLAAKYEAAAQQNLEPSEPIAEPDPRRVHPTQEERFGPSPGDDH